MKRCVGAPVLLRRSSGIDRTMPHHSDHSNRGASGWTCSGGHGSGSAARVDHHDPRCAMSDIPRPIGDRVQPHQPLPPIAEALDARATTEALLFEIRRVIVGQDAMLERVLVALLAGGHLLLEGVPGLAKTLTIRTLAEALDVSFKRIQFTPDLVPADLIGTRVYRPDHGSF